MHILQTPYKKPCRSISLYNLIYPTLFLCTCTTLARVTPKIVTASAQALSANVQWNFGRNVENRIKTFIVEVIPDEVGSRVGVATPVSIGHKERFATFSSLKPNTTYHLKVIAEYEDSVRAESDKFTFTTSGAFF